ncbi:hypothetical protein ACSSS7_000972 [Eimeria intestinalis]
MEALGRVDVLHRSFPGRRWAELRVDLDAPISSVKDKLYRHTGTVSDNMSLQLLVPGTSGGQQQMFGCLPAGCTLVIADSSAADTAGAFSAAAPAAAADVAAAAAADGDADISKRYMMPDEVYEQRERTMRQFLRGLQTTRPDLFQQQQQQQQQPQQEQQQQGTEEEIRLKFQIGLRCQLSGDRRGRIAFVGRRPSRPQEEIWIGVALDEPLGRTDGRDFRVTGAATAAPAPATAGAAAAGRGEKLVYSSNKLFDCDGQAYGEFALPAEVAVGDFPPLDPFALVDEI